MFLASFWLLQCLLLYLQQTYCPQLKVSLLSLTRESLKIKCVTAALCSASLCRYEALQAQFHCHAVCRHGMCSHCAESVTPQSVNIYRTLHQRHRHKRSLTGGLYRGPLPLFLSRSVSIDLKGILLYINLYAV